MVGSNCILLRCGFGECQASLVVVLLQGLVLAIPSIFPGDFHMSGVPLWLIAVIALVCAAFLAAFVFIRKYQERSQALIADAPQCIEKPVAGDQIGYVSFGGSIKRSNGKSCMWLWIRITRYQRLWGNIEGYYVCEATAPLQIMGALQDIYSGCCSGVLRLLRAIMCWKNIYGASIACFICGYSVIHPWYPRCN